MLVTTLKELNKLMLLCRKQGIRSMKIDNMEFVIDLDHGQQAKTKTKPYAQVIQSYDDTIQTPDQLTDEQLLMYSAEGLIPVEAMQTELNRRAKAEAG